MLSLRPRAPSSGYRPAPAPAAPTPGWEKAYVAPARRAQPRRRSALDRDPARPTKPLEDDYAEGSGPAGAGGVVPGERLQE